VPKRYEGFVKLLLNMLGTQVKKLSSIPAQIERNLFSLDKPKRKTGKYNLFTIVIAFEFPTNSIKQFEAEQQKLLSDLKVELLNRKSLEEVESIPKSDENIIEGKKSNGCWLVVITIILFFDVILFSLVIFINPTTHSLAFKY